jgi:YHS domain-containing protein
MTTTPGADLPLTERDVTLLIADLAGVHRTHGDPRQPLRGVRHFALPGRHEGADLIDPVCQMRVDPVTTAAQLTHGGRTYHFCSPECARTFATRVEGSGGSTWT